MVEYRVEIWGWKERKELEGLQERYLKWVLGVEWGKLGYMVRDELQRVKLRCRAGGGHGSLRRDWGWAEGVHWRGNVEKK